MSKSWCQSKIQTAVQNIRLYLQCTTRQIQQCDKVFCLHGKACRKPHDVYGTNQSGEWTTLNLRSCTDLESPALLPWKLSTIFSFRMAWQKPPSHKIQFSRSSFTEIPENEHQNLLLRVHFSRGLILPGWTIPFTELWSNHFLMSLLPFITWLTCFCY